MKTILLIEDNRGLGNRRQSLIEQLGYRVVQESTVSRAAEVLKNFTIDVIVINTEEDSQVAEPSAEDSLRIVSRLAFDITPPPQIVAIRAAAGTPNSARNHSKLPNNVVTLQQPISDADLVTAVQRLCDVRQENQDTQSNTTVDDLVQRLEATQLELARSQAALNNAPSGIFWTDSDGRLIDTNDWTCKLLGYTREELLGKTVADFDSEVPSVTFYRDELLPSIADTGLSHEGIYTRKDGSPITVEVTLRRQSDGEQPIICAYIQDISKRRTLESNLLSAQSAAEESELRFRSLADSASPLSWTTELDSTCSWLSARWLDYSGKSMEDQQGYGWLQTVHPEDRDRVAASYTEAFKQQKEFSLDYRLKRHDGVYRWFTVNATPRRDRHEAFIGFVGMSFDCHDTKLQLDELQQSQTDLASANSARQAMLDILGSSDGVWDWSIGTDDSQFTPGFRKILGFEEDDLEALPNTLAAFDSRIHPHDHADFWQSLKASCEERSTLVKEYRIRDANDQYLWVRTRGNASYNSEGVAVRFVGLTFDISDRKQAELALAAEREALAESNKDLSQFAYVASHDLQEPLRAIGGFLQLLERKYSDKLDEKGRGYIQKSVAGAARMNQLINDLLFYSKISRTQSTISDVPLNWVVESIQDEYEDLIAREKAVIEVGQLPTISGARPLLLQLFRNLIGNALKYRSSETPRIQVTATAETTDWVIRVQDNGIGIEELHKHRIFELFARLHDRETYPGTGIGLAICKRVVDRLGGTIEVEENSKPGSCFVVRLPADAKA